MGINKDNGNFMNKYANDLSSGIYDEDKILLSEKYYLMAINHKNDVSAMHDYADCLVKGLYGPDIISLSEKYYLMTIDKGNILSIKHYADCITKGLYGDKRNHYLKILFNDKYVMKELLNQ
jgi:hypothetical protein